jgi:hypothetical protein
MYVKTILIVSLFATLSFSAPVTRRQNTAVVGSTEGAGGGIGEVTGAADNAILGPNNIKAADQIADTAGVAQYPNGDGGDDSHALPQNLLTNTIGAEGLVTEALPAPQLQNDAVATNDALDEIGTSTDQIANNLVGVPCENTSPQSVGCPAGTQAE